MIKGESVNAISEFATTSDYFLQVTIEKSGRVISSNSGVGPIPTLFGREENPLYFADCFLSLDWTKYESQRIKAMLSQKKRLKHYLIIGLVIPN